jgi:L-asparaginase II
VTTTQYAGGVPIAEVVRSGFVESRHHGSVTVLDASGQAVAGLGDPYGPIFPRSSNKPMQAVAMLRCGLSVEDADLAVVAASHSAEPSHVERVGAMLERAGLDESALACPPDLPLSAAARADMLRAGGRPARILMNCSGKHAGMLLTCVAAGWSTVDYVDPGHPLQVACRAAVEELAVEPVTSVGVDGCGAPVFALSLAGLARAFLACVEAPAGTPQRRVADAMRAYPELMSGAGREDASLMRATPGLLAKGGAEGVIAVAIPGVGAVAVKIDDGAERARPPALVAALRRLGIASDALDRLGHVPVLGGGRVVGEVRLPQTLPDDLGLRRAS